MELNWSLKEIYPSFDSDEFKGDLKNLTELIENIKSWTNEVIKDNTNLAKKLEDYIEKFTSFEDLEMRLYSFVNLTISADTKNKQALRYSDILEKKLTELVESSTKLEKWISNIEDLDSIINRSKLLKEHEFILKSIVEQSKYLLSDKKKK